MSYYYKYDFASPEPLFATVREELKSYFDTGAIDDLMFPTYLDKCLRKLGKSSYPIREEVLFIEDYQARLPDNFLAVREAWLCAEVEGSSFQSPTSFYSQAVSATTIQIAPMTIGGQDCTNPECIDGCPSCMPQIAQAVYKTNTEVGGMSFKRLFMLKPGNISTRKTCDLDYMCNWQNYSQTKVNTGTPYSSTYDSFDIHGNKFTVNFRTGVVYLVFYATDYDNCGSQLVPNNYRIMEYIEAFIKYKMFETLLNQVNDETYNQLREKMLYYKSLSDEAFIMADVEIKKQTIWQKQNRIIKSYNRHKKFEIPYRRR